MHDATIWAAWYLLLLAIPALLIGSFIRDKTSRHHADRRKSLH